MMFRKYLLLILITGISYNGIAQFLSLGLKGGVGLSKFHEYYSGKLNAQEAAYSYRLANFNGGITANLKISEKWYFHSEIIFEDKGGKFLNKQDTIEVNYKQYVAFDSQRIHNYYLQFPQSIRYLIPLSKKDRIAVYIEAGGYFGYYFHSKSVEHLKYDDTVNKDVSNYYWGDNSGETITYHRFDWGVTGGVGLLTRVWKGVLDLNFKYDRMLQPYASASNSTKVYYDVFGITIGYSLPVLWKDFH
jgi:hypothetical protein